MKLLRQIVVVCITGTAIRPVHLNLLNLMQLLNPTKPNKIRRTNEPFKPNQYNKIKQANQKTLIYPESNQTNKCGSKILRQRCCKI
jgi:hypothetical protein